MGFILFYKRIFLALYAINFILLFYHILDKGGFGEEIAYSLLITPTVFAINFYTYLYLRSGTARTIHLFIETLLSYCRLIFILGSALYIALFFIFLSPVNFVIWPTSVKSNESQ